MSAARILIVEDEVRLADLLADYLRAAGYAVSCLHAGTDAVARIREQAPDLVLLDLMLPGKDGMQICREVRSRSSVPIIMTTAKVEEIDRLLGLELGADDYICKPYSPREVVARVRAVLRRTQPQGEAAAASAEPLDLRLDPEQLKVHGNGRVITLSTVEFALLEVLVNAPGRIFSRDQLMDRIYPDRRIVSERTIDSHIRKLRRRLEELAPKVPWIQSVYGAGYRYEPTVEQANP